MRNLFRNARIHRANPAKTKTAASSKGVQLNTFQKRDCKSRLRTEHDSFIQHAALDVRCSGRFRKKGPHLNAGWAGEKKSVAALAGPILGRRPNQLKCTQRRIVWVGIMVTQNPLFGSGHAGLPHPALTSANNAVRSPLQPMGEILKIVLQSLAVVPPCLSVQTGRSFLLQTEIGHATSG